ncbi:MAG TPA: HAMP domain-containing sensor histidine kinase, partial [Polyangiales bacterium]
MFPFIPSGSSLHLRAGCESIAIGDVVAYSLASSEGLIAHRVMRIAPDECVVRGDAQTDEEVIARSAIAYVVTRVDHRRFAYDTGGRVGRLLARIALRRGIAFHLLARLARVALRLPELTPSEPACAGDPIRLSSSRPSLSVHVDVDPRDSLLRGLKHELRTPLNAILGFAEVLLGELDGPLNDDARENVTVVREAGQKLLSLINEVLDLAAALVAQREPHRQETDVSALLEEVRSMLEERRGVRPVYVRVATAGEQLHASIDRRALARVITALGELALIATSSGEISLQANLNDRALRIRVHGDGLLVHDFASEPPVKSERDKRLFRLRLLIARKLTERLPGRLALEPSSLGSSLILEVPIDDGPGTAAISGASLDDVSMAIGYLAAMGHDLRTPLNAILGFADLLSLSARDPWSEPQQKSLAIIRERAGDLAALVDDMIDWAKLEAGELALQRTEQAVHSLIERAVATAIERSGARGLQIELDIGTELGEVVVDGTRFVQALVGLLDHAVRSNPAPQVKLTARRQPS